MEDMTPPNSPLTKVISAASIAMSVPVPIATPTLDCFNAGASLIPSPTIATTSYCFCKFLISSTFPSGKTSEIT